MRQRERGVRAGGHGAAVLAVVAMLGCATPSPAPEAPPEVPVAMLPPVLPAPAMMCPVCLDQTQEVARLREELASREAELRDLRASQREQVRVIQESSREVVRAKAKMRRLATQAEAASYIAEVEVALKALRASLPAGTPAPILGLAESLLRSTAAPFAQGDYGTAMDRAAEAEQLAATYADRTAERRSRARNGGESVLHVAIPLKVVADTELRKEPRASSAVAGDLRKDSLVMAHAYTEGWMRVTTADGRGGWVSQAHLGAR